METISERIVFRLFHMECCGHMLCWVNPRYPTYCPQCGECCYPLVKSMTTLQCENAWIKYQVQQ